MLKEDGSEGEESVSLFSLDCGEDLERTSLIYDVFLIFVQ